MLAGYLVALGTSQLLPTAWLLTLFGWAALGLGWAAARSRQLVPYIRLPSSIAGLGGGSGHGGGRCSGHARAGTGCCVGASTRSSSGGGIGGSR